MSKGLSEIATSALYVGITISAISVALTAGLPALENLQDSSSIEGAETFMHNLDSNIQEVVAGGEGSTRTMDLNFDRGQMYYDEEREALVYELETDAEAISPQSSQRSGNVIISSNADVMVYEDEVNGEDCYRMENERVSACIRQVGDQDNWENIDTGDLLLEYRFIADGQDIDFGADMDIKLNDIDSTSYGTGYTQPESTGGFIGTGRTRATISSDYGFTYDVIFSLPNGADFLQIDVQNYR